MTDAPSTNASKSRPRLGLLLFVLVVLIAIGWQVHRARGGGDDRVPWRDDFAVALGAAQATGKPILANFTADWCPPCQEMNRFVYSRLEVAESIDAGFIPLRIDLTRPDRQQQALAIRYAVMGTPTLMVLDHTGKPLSIASGFVDAQTLMAWLEKYGEPGTEPIGSEVFTPLPRATSPAPDPEESPQPQGTPP